MTVDPDELFIFELSIALKIPVFEIKEWPLEIIDQYRAMSIVRPFTEHTKAVRDGYSIELFRNRNVTKEKDWVSKEEILPYLSDKLPDSIEHEYVKKAIDQLAMAKRLSHKFMRDDIVRMMKEQIELEYEKGNDRDMYLIKKFYRLIRENKSE